MRILFTTPILEHPAAGGPQLRIENSLKALSKICDIHLLYRTSDLNYITKSTNTFFGDLVKSYTTFEIYPYRFKSTILRYFVNSFFYLTVNKRALRVIVDLIERNDINLIWFGYGNISYSLIRKVKKQIPHVKIVCDTDSVWSRFILRELPYAKKLRKISIYIRGKLKQRQEKSFVNLSDITLAVSEVDACYYRLLTKDKEKIKIFANVIDLNEYSINVPIPESLKRPSVYLAGTFGSPLSAMNIAASWLIQEIMPLVWELREDIRLYIVGRNSEKQFGNINNPLISVLGEVKTVLPFLKNSDVAVVPLMFESGTRFKILEAAACKIPIVSTSLGAEGIDVVHASSILIANTAEDFAASIIKLINDSNLSRLIAEDCYRLIKDKYEVSSLVKQGHSVLNKLG
jgi:glycosyltransferase involved in cell wall biosynthesis